MLHVIQHWRLFITYLVAFNFIPYGKSCYTFKMNSSVDKLREIFQWKKISYMLKCWEMCYIFWWFIILAFRSSIIICCYGLFFTYVVRCAIWVPFVQFKKREKHLWRSVNFSKVAGLACNFTKINTPPWVFFTFFKLYKWYLSVQSITYVIHIKWK